MRWLLFGLLAGCDALYTSDEEALRYYDRDQDGFPVAAAGAVGSNGPFDCDDDDADVFPAADERCNGVDDDCDVDVDEEPVDGSSWYLDDDRDGYGDAGALAVACEAPADHVADDTDCDDTTAARSPIVAEECNDIDDDCDGDVDEGGDFVEWYPDADGDGFGDADGVVLACAAPTPDWVLEPGDCDDANAAVNPSAEEVWYDDVDQDCDGASDYDQDGDGYDALEHGGDDCDDRTPDASPAGIEVCNDGLDNDCDGTDNGCRLTGTLDLPGDADARFTIPTPILAAAELTGDGVPDLVIGSGSTVYVFDGPFAGTMGASAAYASLTDSEDSTEISGVAAGADMDGDGSDDLLIARGGTTQVFGHSGPLAAGAHALTSSDVTIGGSAGFGAAVHLTDLDADGDAEIVASTSSSTGWNRAYAFRAPASGSLSASTADLELPMTCCQGTTHLGTADFNGDAHADLAVGAPPSAEGGTGLVYATYGPVFSDPETIELSTSGTDLGSSIASSAGDVNGDGYDDLLVGAAGTEARAYLWVGTAAGLSSPAATTFEHPTSTDGFASAVALGDLDGDGHSDVIIGAWLAGSAGSIYVYYGPVATGTLSGTSADLVIRGSFSSMAGYSLATHDLDTDGRDDLIIGSFANVDLLFGEGR